MVYQGTVPAKANTYGVRHKKGGGGFYTTDEVEAFQSNFGQALLDALGRPVRWEIPESALKEMRKGRTKRAVPRPVDPPFPRSERVDVVFMYCPGTRQIRNKKTGKVYARPENHHDVDGLLKAIGDAITKAGIWYDDRQVANWIALEGGPVIGDPVLALRIQPRQIVPERFGFLQNLGEPRYLCQPSPLSRREWTVQKKQEHALERALQIPDAIAALYCARCCQVIGPWCFEEEAWLEPSLGAPNAKGQRKLEVSVICGSCADRYSVPGQPGRGLAAKYCAIGRAEMRTLRRFQVMPRIQDKITELRGVVDAARGKQPRREPGPGADNRGAVRR